MPGFPLTKDMSAENFRRDIIDRYFNVTLAAPTAGFPAGLCTLQAKIDKDATLEATDKSRLIEDYCKLGSFFTHTEKVKTALIKLEEALREELNKAARTELKGKITNFNLASAKGHPVTNRHNEPIYFKTDKLLSGVLTIEENASGFNGFEGSPARAAARTAILHSTANVGVKNTGQVVKTGYGFQMQQGGRPGNPVPLPTGVPGMTSGVGGVDFNRILLRHGYQWKDVGAGAKDHGEYTHRVQWYAITKNNRASADLNLTNTPLQVFKSMGALLARSTWPLPVDQQPESKTYLWECIFDCFKSESFAKAQGSIAWTDQGFNCPDNLTAELIKMPPDLRYVEGDASNLFCLRVLMNARHFKRNKVEDIDPLRRLMENDKKVTEAFRQDPTPQLQAPAYLVWYFTER